MKNVGKNKNGFEKYELTLDECKELMKLASESMKFTYPTPNSGYSVAVLTKNEKIFTGASYNSDSHNLTMHGEAVALANAAQHGETEIVAITGPNCHNCKQLIWESSIRSRIDTVIIIKEEGKFKQVPISKLMLYPWPDCNGNH